jgi:hypothetical protein
MLTISAAAAPPPITGYHVAGMAGIAGVLPLMGLCGLAFAKRKRNLLAGKNSRSMTVLALLLVISMFSLLAVGCGGSSKAQTSPPAGSPITLTVTGTSGAITQSAPVTITIN